MQLGLLPTPNPVGHCCGCQDEGNNVPGKEQTRARARSAGLDRGWITDAAALRSDEAACAARCGHRVAAGPRAGLALLLPVLNGMGGGIACVYAARLSTAVQTQGGRLGSEHGI